MLKRCVIVIPIYDEDFDSDIYRTINNTYTLYKDKYDIFFICSDKLNISKYQLYFPHIKYKFFDNIYFTSQSSYSYLMLNYLFYKEFLAYEYMLLVQTDAYIFNGYSLEYFLDKNYIILGALVGWCWGEDISKINFEMAYKNNITLYDYKQFFNNCELFLNGGLTLRKIDVLYHILKGFYQKLTNKINNPSYYFKDVNLDFCEDYQICNLLNNFNMLDNILVKDIIRFSVETNIIDYATGESNHIIDVCKDFKIVPFGAHKKYYNFIDIIK